MPTFKQSAIAGWAVAVMLFMAGIFAAVWSIDDHFVTRREFNELRQDVSAIRRHFGIPRPATEPTSEGDAP